VGADVARRDLAEEALFLGRLVAELLPEEPEALGLLGLMLHAEARRRARGGPGGEYVPLAEQDVSRWDHAMIQEAEAVLLKASRLGSIGRYQLEGAIQSAHAHRRLSGVANWQAIVELYDALFALSHSPVVAINRALAINGLRGPAAALEALREVEPDSRVTEYQPYWAARAELLARTGEHREARNAYEIAIGLERDPAVRSYLQHKRAALPA
jgi:predicted RNA polymerase sigma factor